ncbi:N-acetylmuramoyl-L-alanine amidase [Sutcliffiella cohnii]|uniref:N-acetylmuramoyl-L-alanine amidase n=1 Tax=Sutcliffiella cohnii TaxID=33932 RepID=UPI002E218B57|nr:N-acetylmuramoyl-L-alanine amidase [Sutcliffiella cohnii]
MKIVLDAGHGYSTAGKRTPDGMREYEFNRVVANYARTELLKYQDVQVLFTHSDDRDVPLSERCRAANNWKAELFVSIHANAFGNGGWADSAHGIETYIHPVTNSNTPKIAKAIHDSLIKATGRRDRGVKTANFQVLRETDMSAVLAECGFMTNREEAALLKTSAYRKKCALAIVDGIVSHYKLKKKPTPKPEQPKSNGLYKVQTGAFSNKENAEKLAEQLKKAGFDTYIVRQ